MEFNKVLGFGVKFSSKLNLSNYDEIHGKSKLWFIFLFVDGGTYKRQ